MQSRGPLMVEHRLIERVIAVVERELPGMRFRGTVDPLFVDAIVDFLRSYADRTHHGKEEDILFRRLETRPLSDEDRQAMDELTRDHVFARQTTREVVEANSRYRTGEARALPELVAHLEALVGLYPGHITREDKVFFAAARAYFTDEEDQAMLADFWEFDRTMIHEKYKAIVEGLER